MFHLLTHAFFKAMLFLGAGSVIHGMHHEQDMRNYGGLKDKLPWTFRAMMIGTLAITGVGIPLLYVGFPVGFAGFVSKDAIIESAFAGHASYAFWMLVVSALFTSFYSWRLLGHGVLQAVFRVRRECWKVLWRLRRKGRSRACRDWV